MTTLDYIGNPWMKNNARLPADPKVVIAIKQRERTYISLRLLSFPFYSTALLYYLCFAYCIKENE